MSIPWRKKHVHVSEIFHIYVSLQLARENMVKGLKLIQNSRESSFWSANWCWQKYYSGYKFLRNWKIKVILPFELATWRMPPNSRTILIKNWKFNAFNWCWFKYTGQFLFCFIALFKNTPLICEVNKSLDNLVPNVANICQTTVVHPWIKTNLPVLGYTGHL